MTRYLLEQAAMRDLDEIRQYLACLPAKPHLHIAGQIRQEIEAVAVNPYRGKHESEMTRTYGQEIRSWPVLQYRIDYRVRTPVEILAVLHSARDHISLLRERIH